MTTPDWVLETTWGWFEALDEYTSERKLRLYCVACARTLLNVLSDKAIVTAIDLAERVADGLNHVKELEPLHTTAQTNLRSIEQRREQLAELEYFRGEHAASLTEIISRSTLTKVDAQDISDTAGGVRAYERIRPGMGTTEADTEFEVGCTEQLEMNVSLLRDIFGNPFHPVTVDRSWLTPDVTALAQAIYDERRFADMPILADALEEAGCTNDEILEHCRVNKEHVRGCWVVDLLLIRE